MHIERPTTCGLTILMIQILIEQRKDALRSRELQFQVGAMDDHKNQPTLIGKLKIDWLNFPVDDILRQFTTLKDGILRGVFKQQTARAWYGCRAEKAQVIFLLPGKCCYSTWTDYTYDEINDRLFVNPGRNENILDSKSKVGRHSPEYWQWMGQIDYMWQFQDGQVRPVQIKMEDAIAEYQANLRNEQAEVAVHKPLVRKRWKTKDGTFQVKRKQVVDDDPSVDPQDQMDESSPEREEATFSKMLRDV